MTTVTALPETREQERRRNIAAAIDAAVERVVGPADVGPSTRYAIRTALGDILTNEIRGAELRRIIEANGGAL